MHLKKIITGLSLIIALSACQTQRNMEFSEWRAVDAENADLNIAEFSPVKITSIALQDRDNRVRNSKYHFEGKNGILQAQRVMGAWFNVQTENEIRSKDAINKLAKNANLTLHIDESSVQKINHRSQKSIGYYAYGTVVGMQEECIVAYGGYRLRPTAYDNDMNYVDTVIDFLYCAKNVRKKDFNKMFRNLNLN
ncbi:MAG: hypothetical protein HWE30_16230 [Methylocystaceae bacterium]|nr:hypothetical protein [Methylocystaceae bacterium]